MQKGGRVLLGLGQRAGHGRHRFKKNSSLDCRNAVAIQTWSVVCEGQIQAWSNIQENEKIVAACLRVRHAVEQQNHRAASETLGEEMPPSHHARIAERHEIRSCGAGQKGTRRRKAGTGWDASGGHLSQKIAYAPQTPASAQKGKLMTHGQLVGQDGRVEPLPRCAAHAYDSPFLCNFCPHPLIHTAADEGVEAHACRGQLSQKLA